MTVPVRQGLSCMYGRSTGFLRFGEQRIVVFFSGLVRVRTYDLGNLSVEVAVTPCPKPLIADHVRQGARCVAPEVALVVPVLLIEVEVLAGEQINRQRCHTCRWTRGLVLLRTLPWCTASLLGHRNTEQYGNKKREQQCRVRNSARNAHQNSSIF